MFKTIKNLRNDLVAKFIYACSVVEQEEYDAMIAASQAKLAETKLVPGYTKIYA